jgi:hypothetical protein
MYLDATEEVINELESEGIDVIHPDEMGAFDVKGGPDDGEE